jgi:hypothetical protein
MKRCILAGFLLTALILSIQFTGCGSDKKGVEPTPGPSMNDPSYRLAAYIFDNSDTGVELACLWSLLDSYRIILSQPDAPTYHAGSGFWYKEETQVDTIYSDANPSVIINTIPSVIRDSLRFWQGGTAVQTPNPALLTRIEVGFYIGAAADSTTDSMEMAHALNITADPGEFMNIDSGIIVFAGNGSMFGRITQIDYPDSTAPNLDSLGVCEVQTTIASNVTGLTLNLGDIYTGCPTAGTIASAGPIDVTYCQGINRNLEFPATWTSTTTFNGDAITIVTKSPTRTWTKHETCSGL